SPLPLSFKNQAASCCFCCGYVGNAFVLSKRSGISTALAAASILSMPARQTAHRHLVVHRLVRAPKIVEVHPGTDAGPRLAAIGVGFQMHFFVLDRAP